MPRPQYNDEIQGRKRLAETLTDVSSTITELVPALVYARVELEHKLGKNDTVTSFNEVAMDLAGINPVLREAAKFLTAARPARKQIVPLLEKLDEASQKWERASDRFDDIADAVPANLLSEKRAGGKRVGAQPRSQAENQEILEALAQLRQVSPDWNHLLEEQSKKSQEEENLFAYYEERLKKVGTLLGSISQKLPHALELARDTLEADKDRRR